MKIRNGFVSNSSSSSFAVAFPRKPDSVEETLEILFGEDIEGNVTIYEKSLSKRRVAEIVFGDINDAEKVDRTGLAELFGQRYWYEYSTTIQWAGRKDDEHGGSFYCGVGRYCMSDEDLRNVYKMLTIEKQELIGALENEMEALLAVNVALLTVFDMCKGLSPQMSLDSIEVLEKTGGRSALRVPVDASWKAAVLVCSDSASSGEREDEAGVRLERKIGELGFAKVGRAVVPDDLTGIRGKVLCYCEEGYRLVITCGGTNL